jgi:hypothetical protein
MGVGHGILDVQIFSKYNVFMKTSRALRVYIRSFT